MLDTKEHLVNKQECLKTYNIIYIRYLRFRTDDSAVFLHNGFHQKKNFSLKIQTLYDSLDCCQNSIRKLEDLKRDVKVSPSEDLHPAENCLTVTAATFWRANETSVCQRSESISSGEYLKIEHGGKLTEHENESERARCQFSPPQVVSADSAPSGITSSPSLRMWTLPYNPS